MLKKGNDGLGNMGEWMNRKVQEVPLAHIVIIIVESTTLSLDF